MTQLQNIVAAAGWQTRVNENFRSVAPAGLYGIDPSNTTGQVLGYLGGEFNGVTVINGSVTLTANATNYVVAHRTTGVVTTATNTTNWLNTATYMQLYQLVSGPLTFTISSTSDKRQTYGGSGSGGSSTLAALTDVNIPSPTNGQVLTYDSATSKWVSAAGGGGVSGDMLSPLLSAEISITTAATLTIGRQHVCSGTTVAYTVTLPAASGNSGNFLSLRMAPGLTRLITLKGNSAELIDGLNTRVMWAGESAILYCDGTGWSKMGGRSKAMAAYMYRTGAFSSFTTSNWTLVPLTNIQRDNTSSLSSPMADTGNGVIWIRRAGLYQMSGALNLSGVTPGYFTGLGAMNDNTGSVGSLPSSTSDNPYSWLGQAGGTAGPLAGRSAGAGSSTINAAAGSYCKIVGYNSMASSPSSTDDPSDRPILSVTEILDW